VKRCNGTPTDGRLPWILAGEAFFLGTGTRKNTNVSLRFRGREVRWGDMKVREVSKWLLTSKSKKKGEFGFACVRLSERRTQKRKLCRKKDRMETFQTGRWCLSALGVP